LTPGRRLTPGLRPGLAKSHRLRTVHHAYRLYAHITWGTWQRVGCINQLVVRDIQSALASACEECGVHVLASGILADHMHVVVSFRPDTRLCDFVRLTKAVSATRANRRVMGAIKWARGYHVTTVGTSELKAKIKYVENQFKRHPDRIPKSRRPRIPPTPGASPG
jgi:REP element-mobilizing transposase RayT